MDIEPYDKSNVGRKPGEIDYYIVTYKDKKYIVGEVKFKDDYIKFVFDEEDFEKVKKFNWHVASGKYIGSSYYVWIDDEKRKMELYLHNLIMKRDAFQGKGQSETVDHINRIGFDNRKENLRILSQSEQNINQNAKKRTLILPDNFPIKAEDIPRHIWYVRANGNHGDRFAIEFKTERICWKTTSSKSVSIQDKLRLAKEKLAELYTEYPYLNSGTIDNSISELKASYEEIIRAVPD